MAGSVVLCWTTNQKIKALLDSNPLSVILGTSVLQKLFPIFEIKTESQISGHLIVRDLIQHALSYDRFYLSSFLAHSASQTCHCNPVFIVSRRVKDVNFFLIHHTGSACEGGFF